MSYDLWIAREAEQCIEDQLEWYEADERQGGTELADRWLSALEDALATLMEHPERHGFAPENERWHPEISIRQMRFRPWKTPSTWRGLFVIDENTKRVTVLQIRHGKRRLLDDEQTD